MKKVFSALVLTSLLAVPVIGLAQTCSTYTTQDTCINANCMWNPTTSKCLGTSIREPGDLVDLITRIGNWIFAALLALAAVMLTLAGFFWVTAGGDPEKVKKASDTLKYALIGVAIALGAKGMIAVIENLIAGQ